MDTKVPTGLPCTLKEEQPRLIKCNLYEIMLIVLAGGNSFHFWPTFEFNRYDDNNGDYELDV